MSFKDLILENFIARQHFYHASRVPINIDPNHTIWLTENKSQSFAWAHQHTKLKGERGEGRHNRRLGGTYKDWYFYKVKIKPGAKILDSGDKREVAKLEQLYIKETGSDSINAALKWYINDLMENMSSENTRKHSFTKFLQSAGYSGIRITEANFITNFGYWKSGNRDTLQKTICMFSMDSVEFSEPLQI